MFPKQTMAFSAQGEEEKEKPLVREVFLPGQAAVPRPLGLPVSAAGRVGAETAPGTPDLPSGSGSFCSARRASRFRFRFTSRSTIYSGREAAGARAYRQKRGGGGGWRRGYRGAERGVGRGRNRSVPYLLPCRQHVLGQLLHLGQVTQHEGRVPRHSDTETRSGSGSGSAAGSSAGRQPQPRKARSAVGGAGSERAP